jgi:hypothetical protein
MASWTDASLSLCRLLYIATLNSGTALELHLGIEKYCMPWHRESESASARLCALCSCSQKDNVLHVRHDMIT